MREMLSVIMPIYNVEKYIRKCLDSVLGQTYANLEIILVLKDNDEVVSNIPDLYKHNAL